MADLRVTDPRHDKKYIQDMRGGLIQKSYVWVLENPDFCRWRDNETSQLLWVKGDPGKGKTMLLCGIIDHLEKESVDEWVLSYFFCQATDRRVNTATSVLRGLIYMLLDQNASLESYMKKKYETAGQALFEDENEWEALTEIFIEIVQDTEFQAVCLVVDALDECVEGLPQLLDLIVYTSECTTAKWLVSSRDCVAIDEKLCNTAHSLSLELNAEFVHPAVKSYIVSKLTELTRLKGYQENTVVELRRYLLSKADNNFLWITLVCHELADSKVSSRHNVTLDTLKSLPQGLYPFYQWMIERISHSRDAEACFEILALASTVYRPVSVDELKGLARSRSIQNIDQYKILEIIASCGSFLTLQDDIVSFVHQSAKDFLLRKASSEILRSGIQYQHSEIFKISLDLLGNTLRRDIYVLRNPGFPIDKVKTPSLDPLSSIRYSCVYWADHLQDAGFLSEAGINEKPVLATILKFLKTSYLHWLEALSLMHNIPEGVRAIQKLEKALSNNTSEELRSLVQDARHFLLSQKGSIEIAPLQTYTSALIFSPTNSLVRKLYHEDFPPYVELAPKTEADWNACLRTPEDHSDWVRSVSISSDGRRLASGSGDMTIKLWDADSGACLQTLGGHSDWVRAVAISSSGHRLASGSCDKMVRLWDAESGACLQTLEGHSYTVTSVAISSNGDKLASGSYDKTVRIWDAESGICLETLEGHSYSVTSVAISRDGRRLASGSCDKIIKLWDAESGACLRTLNVSCAIYSLAFYPNHDACLLSDIGDISLDPSLKESSASTQVTVSGDYSHNKYGISPDHVWILQDGENLIWIPPEYRPLVFTVTRSTMAVGCRSGRVWVMRFFENGHGVV
ncbi:nwd1 protein [Phlyctema vagabunda]|uniref:Nwd1 protein n=1 Tax=Phlyctema vagabunda TaxID=108571 RepID=A0ABR4P2P2_9HELO